MSFHRRRQGARQPAQAILAGIAITLGCFTLHAQSIARPAIEQQVRSAIDSLASSMASLQPDRMLAAWAPGADVLHASNASIARIDTLLPSLYPVWRARRAFKMTWTMRALRVLGPSAAVATTSVRFVATDTLGVTTTREGVWTMVFAESGGAWKIVADHRTMQVVPERAQR
jgi:ketosteroid isomerase-like protein